MIRDRLRVISSTQLKDVPSPLVAILGFFFSFLIFLPLLFFIDHAPPSVTLSHHAVHVIHTALRSNLYLHTCIGALCCTFPLFCEHILDISMAKFAPTTFPQSCLILSIALPSIVLYQAGLQEHVSVGLFLPPSSSLLSPLSGIFSSSCITQELLYFGAILSFHSHFSKSVISKVMTLLVYLCFAFGIMLSGFFNISLVPRAMNTIGWILVLIGISGIYGLFCVRAYDHLMQLYELTLKPSPTSPVSSSSTTIPSSSCGRGGCASSRHSLGDNLYLYILTANLTFRLLLFQLIVEDDPDVRSARGQPFYLMINTISVVVISILNSRKLKIEYFQIQVPSRPSPPLSSRPLLSISQTRFETKRNFVRYISQSVSFPPSLLFHLLTL
jgi:hypothetical protein